MLADVRFRSTDCRRNHRGHSTAFLGSRATGFGRDHGGDPIDFLRTHSSRTVELIDDVPEL